MVMRPKGAFHRRSTAATPASRTHAFKSSRMRWGLLIAFITLSGQSVAQPTASAAAASMTTVARQYLDRAIGLFKEQHINAGKVDWTLVSARAYRAAAGAQSPSDTYDAIRLVIRDLGEKHSKFLTPAEATARKTGVAAGAAKPPLFVLPEVIRLPNATALIRLYGFAGSNAQGEQYSESSFRSIKRLQSAGVCKFLLDLQSNSGGNMYPMLKAVRPLLSGDVLGQFEDVKGELTPWSVRGEGWPGSASVAPSQASAARGHGTPIAVILGPGTASSGEFVAMSLKGQPGVRFFGTPSAGFVTSNSVVNLTDGAAIIMTNGWGRDRTGEKYTDTVRPDVATEAGGPAVDSALHWLATQTCKNSRLR